MGRSGVLPTTLGKVNPKRKTPINAIHLEVGVQVIAFACVLIWGADDVFFSWANAITIGLVLMYVLANIGVVKYYLTEGRAQFNPLLHIVVPVVATAAGVVVVWYSYFSPFASGVVLYGLMVFIAVLAITILALVYMRIRRHEEWMHKAQLVFEESGGGH
jgi:amino acid transporter